MTRWQPDARGRLERAALELFLERGFEETTVAEIAARAGLTERTFFRHYADKREVLFGGSNEFADTIVRALEHAPRDLAPINAVRVAIEAIVPFFDGRRDFARERSTIVAAHAELRERELIKLAGLTAALAGAFRERGVAEPAATLVADIGVAVFHVAFGRWLHDPQNRTLGDLIAEGFDEVRAVAGGR